MKINIVATFFLWMALVSSLTMISALLPSVFTTPLSDRFMFVFAAWWFSLFFVLFIQNIRK